MLLSLQDFYLKKNTILKPSKLKENEKETFFFFLTPLLFAYKLNAQITDTSANVYLNKVIDYANTMLEDGRDDSQYGADTCPMFAVYLRRETNILPDFPTFRITGETFYDLDHQEVI